MLACDDIMPTGWTPAAASSTLEYKYDAWISGICRPKFTKPGTRVEQPSVLNNFFSELQYSAAFGSESRKFAGVVWKYAKFRHLLAHPVV